MIFFIIFLAVNAIVLSISAQNLDGYRSDLSPKYSSRTPFRNHLDGYEERRPYRDRPQDYEDDEQQERQEEDFQRRPIRNRELETDSSRPVGRGFEQSGAEQSRDPQGRKAKIVGVDMHMVAGIYPEKRRMAPRRKPQIQPEDRFESDEATHEDYDNDFDNNHREKSSEKPEKEIISLGNPYPKRKNKENVDVDDSETENASRNRTPYRHGSRRPYPEFMHEIPEEFRFPMRDNYSQRQNGRKHQHRNQMPWAPRHARPFREENIERQSSNEDYEDFPSERFESPFQEKSQKFDSHRPYRPRHRPLSRKHFRPFETQDTHDESSAEKKFMDKPEPNRKVSLSDADDELSKSGFNDTQQQQYESDLRRRNDRANAKNGKEDSSISKNMGSDGRHPNNSEHLGNGSWDSTESSEGNKEEEPEASGNQPVLEETDSKMANQTLPSTEPLKSNTTISNEKVKVM